LKESETDPRDPKISLLWPTEAGRGVKGKDKNRWRLVNFEH